MLYKIICLTLISCVYLQNHVTTLNRYAYKTNNYTNVEPQGDTQYKYNDETYRLIQYLPEENIKLFALKSCRHPGIYDQFLLSVNESISVFYDWKSTTSKTWEPKLILSNLDNDETDELIVILTTGTGSGLHEEEVHIIDMKYSEKYKHTFLEEYMLADPFLIIKEKITSQITEREKDVLIQLKVNDSEYNIKMDNIHPGMWSEKVGFGSIIYWGVSENKLFVYINAAVLTGITIGTVTIEYKFNSENEFFNLDRILFEEGYKHPPNW